MYLNEFSKIIALSDKTEFVRTILLFFYCNNFVLHRQMRTTFASDSRM
jgi:hypothetical protein